MAATPNGHVNGGTPTRYIDPASFDPDDPERERELMKSVEVREDMRAMDARKRVSEILNSQAFRDELEEIIETQETVPGSDLKSGPHPASLIALQQISQLILPGNSSSSSRLAGASMSGPVIPIADVRGINSSLYSKGERILRCKLASVYRLMDLRGWTSGIFNHITVRVSQESEHFLLSPFGLLYREVTAGSLVKVDMQGNVVDKGNTNLGISKAGFILHAAIHAARPDINCIIHTHIPSTVAVGIMKQGLLPLSQEAIMLGKVSYHDFGGVLVEENEMESIGRDLGPNNTVMFLRNHGLVVCGSTIEQTWAMTHMAVEACEAQVRLIGVGLDNLIIPSDEAIERTRKSRDTSAVNSSEKKWRAGELEFEAEMRMLDNAGYRTGYVYKLPVVKAERTDKQTSDVEYPPSTSMLAHYDEKGNLKQNIKDLKERNKRLQKTDWLNTPNAYKREEIDEIGTDNPKKITKWVRETSPSHTTPAREVHGKNVFAPIGGERLEMKKMYRHIKDGYYTDKITAGYQSRILDGGVVEGQLVDGSLSTTGDHVKIVGAASKGIIKREHQHNAIVYKSAYTTNPFDKMSDEELKDYEEAVRRGEKPPKEEVLADIQQQLQSEASTEPVEQAPSVEEVTAEMQTSTIESEPAMRRSTSKETNIDEAISKSPTPAPRLNKTDLAPPAIQRGTDQYSSLKAPAKQTPELVDNQKGKSFQRSKSERKPKKGDRPTSPESDPNHNDDGGHIDENGEDSPSKDDKKKKDKKDKKGRMPSFSFGKKKDAKKSKVQTAV
ncbi:alpha-adducin-like isoform X2 [Watersipora subatra]|uniref:alpha-adducin-like isoform X2 n=1 Tax=Watersipora subatra TaxID=2589382 RepID=UPI00355C7006